MRFLPQASGLRRSRVSSGCLAALGSLMLVACGGEDAGRPSGDVTMDPPPPDPGSGPVPCSVDDDFEFLLIDDFERGAGRASWFTNNDVCEVCQEIKNDITELKNRIAGLQGEEAALENPDPSEPPLDPEEVQGRLLEISTQIADFQERIDTLLNEDLPACLEDCLPTQIPLWTAKPVPADEISNNGRCGSRYALHIIGGVNEPLVQWGGTFGVKFGPPIDVVDYEGIAFWARVGPEGRSTITVEVSDQFTDGSFVTADGTPPCQERTSLDDTTLGCDKFGSYAVMGPDWKFFTVPFSEMRQGGWGKPAPFLDLGGIITVQFSYRTGYWDIWVDDVAFYRRK